MADQGDVSMPFSKLSIAAALALASWVLVACESTPRQAAPETAAQRFQRALDDCMSVRRGQMSFCRLQAQAEYRTARAKEQRLEESLRLDFDPSNDTPAQAAARQAWLEATDRCALMNRDARIACMDDAWAAFQVAFASK
jgi:hypothetical protein